MRSVADRLRDETRRRTLTLSPEARVEQALALGDDDVRALCDAKGITPSAARAIIACTRQTGRRQSRVHDQD